MDRPEKIGKYQILDKIGEGGFGVVYKGKDPFIKRLVAIKTCTSGDERVKTRFFREAEIAGNLHHVNVVTIHDFGLEGEVPYLVQEFLTGLDLDEVISESREKIPLYEKVTFLRGIAEGLQYAHSHGVIHRDVKPSNIRVIEGGRVKVMDFGIARLKDEENRLTKTGMTVGTVAYLSPEQLRGDPVDHRTDLFSFGVLAYELLTGERPFRGDTISTLFFRLLNESPPPIVDAELPEALLAVVNRCLEKDPNERYADFSEVLIDLDAVAAEVPGDPETDPFWSQRPMSPITDKFSRLAIRAAQALEARDLTAAEMTLSIARREVDSKVFERDFAPLSNALERLKGEVAAEVLPSSPQLPASSDPVSASGDPAEELSAIEGLLDDGRFDEAAISLTGLELRRPDLPGLRRLHDRMTRAHRRREASGSLPVVPPPAAAAPSLEASRRRWLAVAAGLGLSIVGLLAASVIIGPRAPRPDAVATSEAAIGVDPAPSNRLGTPTSDVDALPAAALDRVVVADIPDDEPRVEVKAPVPERPPVVRETAKPKSTVEEPPPVAEETQTDTEVEEIAEPASPAPVVASPSEPPPIVSEAAARAITAVGTTLAVYQEAWRRLDPKAIRRLHPKVTIRPPQLRGVKSGQVILEGCAYEVRGREATAHCRGVRRLVLENQTTVEERFTQIDLRLRQSGWVIEAIR